MSSVMKALNKRRRWPVDLGDGDKVFIRAMIKREQRESREMVVDATQLEKMSPEERTKAEADMNELRGYFIFGTIILGEGDSMQFPRNEGEGAIDFAKRVESLMVDVPEDNKLLILQAYTKAHSTPSVEGLAKN